VAQPPANAAQEGAGPGRQHSVETFISAGHQW